MPKKVCPKCKCKNLRHVHDSAHGIPGTHMSGSERYECKCGKIIYVNEGKKLGFEFVLDK